MTQELLPCPIKTAIEALEKISAGTVDTSIKDLKDMYLYAFMDQTEIAHNALSLLRSHPVQTVTDEARREALECIDETGMDIVERLRGKVRVPITDGLGKVTPDGNDDYFERMFPASRLANMAADYIEKLRSALSSPVPQTVDVEKRQLLIDASDFMRKSGKLAIASRLDELKQEMGW